VGDVKCPRLRDKKEVVVILSMWQKTIVIFSKLAVCLSMSLVAFSAFIVLFQVRNQGSGATPWHYGQVLVRVTGL
jgi:hypothetical protein